MNDTQLIIAVDPGLVTAVALIHTGDSRSFAAVEMPAMDAVQYVHTSIKTMLHYLDRQAPGQIICESYTVNANTVKHKRQYDALEVIGACRYLAKAYGFEFRLQAPPNRKMVKVAVLKKLGWYQPSKDKHMIDAAQHLAIGCLRFGVLSAEDLREAGLDLQA